MDPRTAHTRPTAAAPSADADTPPASLRRLLAAECAAEAAAAGEDPEELQQAVWLRLLETDDGIAGGSVGAPGGLSVLRLRAAVRAEARRVRRRSRREVPVPRVEPPGEPGAEAVLLAREQRHLLDAAVARLPGRCPALMRALFSGRDLTYAEISDELGMSQGSVGPVRSRCLACLRRMLTASDCFP